MQIFSTYILCAERKENRECFEYFNMASLLICLGALPPNPHRFRKECGIREHVPYSLIEHTYGMNRSCSMNHMVDHVRDKNVQKNVKEVQFARLQKLQEMTII